MNGVDVHRTASMLAVAAYRCQGAVLTLREQYRNMAVQTYFKSRRIHALKLNDEETFLIETVRRFVDREVKPTVQEVEHANEYPEKWIDQMKQIGIYGVAIPEEYGGSPVSMPCYAQVTEELLRGWMSLAGAMGGHTVVAKLISLFGTEEQKVKYLPRMATGEIPGNDGPHRARRRFRSAGHDNQRQERRHRSGRQRRQDMDHQCPPIRRDRLAVQDRSKRKPSSCGHLDRSRRARRRADRLPRPPEARIQGRREL